MDIKLATWKLIQKSLVQRIPVMLLYVLQSNGSSPGRAGFFMAVNAAGEVKGSIGGGIMEHKFVELSKERLHKNESGIVLRKQFHDKVASKDQSGMICSGEQTVLLFPMGSSDLLTIENIIECLLNKNAGSLKITPSALHFNKQNFLAENSYTYKADDDWIYIEQIGYVKHLYIIGAGHCALALSKIMKMMDFYIHLYDDRHPLHTFIENVDAHEKTIINNYSQLKDIIPSGVQNYVVVMTMGYRTDDIAIRSLLKKQFKYFGVLGSSKKLDKLFSDYSAEGIDEQKFKNIYAPIGIPINSKTPEEIAISIAAEIIQVKNSPTCD